MSAWDDFDDEIKDDDEGDEIDEWLAAHPDFERRSPMPYAKHCGVIWR